MNSLGDYVKVYDNVIPDHYCQYLIDRFDENPERWDHIDKGGYPKFKLYYVKEMNDPDLSHVVDNLIRSVYARYVTDLRSTSVPKNLQLSEPKVKKYDKGSDDRYDKHVDITSAPVSRRAIAFLFYLNDVDKGGETKFDRVGKVKAKQGSCVVFPPNWLYPHTGLRALSHDKYIMSAYALYS